MAPRQPGRPSRAAHAPTCRAPARSTRGLFGWRAETIAGERRDSLPRRSRSDGDRGRRRRGARASGRSGSPTSRSATWPRRPSARRELGAAVLLEPREGPAGWRSVLDGPPPGRGCALAAEAVSAVRLVSRTPSSDQFWGLPTVIGHEACRFKATTLSCTSSSTPTHAHNEPMTTRSRHQETTIGWRQ